MALANAQRPAFAPHRPSHRGLDRIAVILNKNAKRVTPRVRREIESIAPPHADVFFTESIEQADFVIRRVIDSGYGKIVTGGGDGTVLNTIDKALAHIDARGYTDCPEFAVLKLGTGNAIADFLGAGDVTHDLSRVDTAPVRNVDLIDMGGQRTTFAGFGYDAHVLNNYHALRQKAERFALTRALYKSALGYVITGVMRTVPELMLRRPDWRVKVINTGGIGRQLDPKGRVIRRIAPGSVAYEGGFGLVCFGTTPYYGYKFNMMPWADKTDGMFQLRVLDLSPVGAVRHLRAAWKGTLDHPGLTDLQLTSCRLEFSEPTPFQVSGDAAGTRDAIDLRVIDPIACTQFAS